MDAFEYDQRFARFVGQVDSSAIRRGTELYEAAAVRVVRMGTKEASGSVSTQREGVYNVRLTFTGEKEMSGSCDCPTYFNCQHSYALARAIRDQLSDRKSGSESVNVRAGRRLGETQVSPKEEDLKRLWKMAKQSEYLLYPKDLYKFVVDRGSFGRVQREPLRDLKKVLVREKPSTLEAFTKTLAYYFSFKGVSINRDWETFLQLREEQLGDNPFQGSALGEFRKDQWDRPALKLHCRIEIVDTEESGWLQVRAKWKVEGGNFSSEEIDTLRKAKGGLVKLGVRGWFQLDDRLPDEEVRLLGVLGLDPDRGNLQRLHSTQAEELFRDLQVEAEEQSKIERSLREFGALESPRVPDELSGLLRPYQKEGFSYLCRLSQLGCGGILADDMGLGKTLQTLAWLLWLKVRNSNKLKALVVSPKSVVDNWTREPQKFATGLSAARFEKHPDESLEVDIVVTNYVQLRLNAEYFLNEKWDAVILDEAQYIKTPESQTTRIAHKLKAKHRIALTGTPIENSLVDLWSVMRFSIPRLLGPLASFRQNYMLGERGESLELLKKRLSPFFLRRLKTQVASELPDRIEEDLYCDLEGEQRKLYEQILDELKASLSGSKKTQSANILKGMLRLRQACCDPYLVDSSEDKNTGKPAKIQAALDIVESIVAEGHKVLVFSQFVKLLDRVGSALEGRGVEFLKLTGQTKERQGLVDRFQDSATEQVFLLSLKAAGSGLTLTAASYVILLDPWWNPAVEAQAIDRAHRIGQRNQVIAYRILAKDTIEEKIRLLQQDKAALAEAVFGESAPNATIDLEEIKRILLD